MLYLGTVVPQGSWHGKSSGLSKECKNDINRPSLILTWSLSFWKVHIIAIGLSCQEFPIPWINFTRRPLVENHAPLAASRTNGTADESGVFRMHWIATGCWKCCLDDFCELVPKDCADKPRLQINFWSDLGTQVQNDLIHEVLILSASFYFQ